MPLDAKTLPEKLKRLPAHDLAFIEAERQWLATARPKQILPVDGWRNAIALSGRGFGKRLCVDTPIPVPGGWARLGDMRVGDELFDEARRVCRIVATHDSVSETAYRLRFSDGTNIDACAEHLWVTLTKQFCPRGTLHPLGHIRSTQQIIDTFSVGHLVAMPSGALVEFIGYDRIAPKPMRCLTVDSRNSMFLCGEGMIPTHNTALSTAWVRRMAGMYPGIIGHVVAPTSGDLKRTVFEGESGLISKIPPAMIAKYSRTPDFELRLVNGSLIRGFSAEKPDRLRGPQSHFTAGDEVAAWLRAKEALSNIAFSTRLAYRTGDGRLIQPQKLFTTTPRPLTWLVELRDAAEIVIEGSTDENRANLAEDFYKEIDKYRGTSIGEQEIFGKILDISEQAIIKQSWLKMWPATEPLPWLEFIIVSMDTAFTEDTYNDKTFERDPTACTVWGVFKYRQRWNLMLLDCWTDYLGFPELVAAAKKEMRKVYGRRTDTLFKPVIGPAWHQEQVKRPDLLIVEEKGSGISLRQQLSKEGIDSWPYNPGRADKLSRLHAVSHVPYHGRIWIPESAKPERRGQFRPYAKPFLDEVCVYSGPKTTPHDDILDSVTQAWRYFADRWMTRADATSDDPAPVSAVIAPQPGDREYSSEDGLSWVEEERGSYG
ncbi:MAG: terminase large subunit domain-containing protein [Pseudomonadota bacterium]